MDQHKIPIKVAEISINKFNEQIHHKVTQLKSFRVSNNATTTLSDMEKMRKDAINCLRVVKQLKQLLIEIENLKARIKPDDLEKFDELTSKRKQEALKEIQLYQDMKPLEKFNELSQHANSNYYNMESPTNARNDPLQIQLQVDDTEVRKRELESRQALLREFENLQSECVAVSQLYQSVNQLVVEQAPVIDKIEENVESAAIDVEEGTKQLHTALSYKKTMYPLFGGLVGAAMLGPVGLVAGLKVGSAAALGGGICGYAGGKFLKKVNSPTSPEAIDISDVTEHPIDDDDDDTAKQSIAR